MHKFFNGTDLEEEYAKILEVKFYNYFKDWELTSTGKYLLTFGKNIDFLISFIKPSQT
jgi:hypothetical protein